MQGNVNEWCADAYADRLPGGSDPELLGSIDARRIFRGGCWFSTAPECRAADRDGGRLSGRNSLVGFRVTRVPRRGNSRGRMPNSGRAFKVSGVGIEMIWIDPGTFTMGSPPSENGRQDVEAQVEVELTRGYWLGQHEVTQGQWSQVMGATPWPKGRSFKEGDRYPATYVSWGKAVEFCARLSYLERAAGRLGEDEQYYLPTEAQWEYACRAGTQTAYSFGDSASGLSAHAWFDESHAHEVGKKKPNAWNLHDMHGNVWEWCADAYTATLPGGSDPESSDSSTRRRALRGGGWRAAATNCRSANRAWHGPFRFPEQGFRVAVVPRW